MFAFLLLFALITAAQKGMAAESLALRCSVLSQEDVVTFSVPTLEDKDNHYFQWKVNGEFAVDLSGFGRDEAMIGMAESLTNVSVEVSHVLFPEASRLFSFSSVAEHRTDGVHISEYAALTNLEKEDLVGPEIPAWMVQENIDAMSMAMASLPCDCAQRWTGGATWNIDGSIDDTPNANDGIPNDPTEGGVIRCGSAAETQSNIQPQGCTYDMASFPIDVSMVPCYSPSTGLEVPVTNPTQGCQLIVFNFDIRTFAYTYSYQLVTNDNIGWAMYYSQQSHQYVGADGLSGSCDPDSLLYLACGDDFNNTFKLFNVPNFPAATNVYLFVWDQGGCNSSLNFNYKARYGCGAATGNCTLVIDTFYQECNGTDSIDFKVAISGNNGTYVMRDVDNNTLDTDTSIITNPGNPMPKVQDTMVITYAAGSPYNILIEEIGGAPNSGECEATFMGTIWPVDSCCTFDITCPPTNGGSYQCIAEIPAADTTLITLNDSCFDIRFVIEESSTGTGCVGDPYILTRRYIVIDDDGDPGTTDARDTCIQTFTVIDDTPPTISCPANVTVSCAEEIPAPMVTSVTFSDNCGLGGLSVIHEGDVSNGMSCPETITRTYRVTDVCGNTAPTISSETDLVMKCVEGPDYVSRFVSPVYFIKVRMGSNTQYLSRQIQI